MKSILYLLFLPLFFTSILDGCNKRDFPVEFEANDIDHFWEAYDKIVDTEDSLLQKQYLRELYLDKGTAGLNDLVKARGYSEEEYLEGILAHPEFWKSIKSNTINTPDYQKEITSDIHKLKSVYPELGPAKIYFSVGAFRTNGTAVGKNVIIGSEQALADKHTAIDEFPEARQTFYKNYRPLENLALLCTHEYIHTQQNELVHNLLSKCLYEGVAEFISCKATGKTSTSPAITYGKANEEIVVEKFVEDLYLMSNDYNWLWGVNRNELKIRDLGYYIGYEICERYYNQSDDKAKAIKELIEIDYKNESQVERIVDASKLLPKPILQLYNEYESKRPTVTKIKEFQNGAQNVNANTKSITVLFSEALNGRHDGLDFGPLGKDYYPKVNNPTRKWGVDNTSYSFEVDLEANKAYQMVITNFRLANGIRLKPYLIEFRTGE